MTSIRQQVFEVYAGDKNITPKNLYKIFPEAKEKTLKRYLMQARKKNKDDITSDKNLSLKDELEKIIKDYKQPASARVQAIREYRTLVEIQPEGNGEDPYLKFLEKQSLRMATTEDISSSQ